MRTIKICLSTLLIVMITIMCMFSVNYSPGVTNDTGTILNSNATLSDTVNSVIIMSVGEMVTQIEISLTTFRNSVSNLFISDNLKKAATQLPIDITITVILLAGLIYMKRYRKDYDKANSKNYDNCSSIYGVKNVIFSK